MDNDSKSYIIKEQNVILNIIEYNKYKLPITKTIDNILFNYDNLNKLLACYKSVCNDPPDIIHSIDWSSINVARTLKEEFKCKWVMGYSLSHTEETKDILKFFDLNIKNDSLDSIKLNNIEN